MAGNGGRKTNVVKEEDVRGLGKSSKNDEGSDESGGRWMVRLSTLKVGPPIGAKPMMGQMGLTQASRVRRDGSQMKEDD